MEQNGSERQSAQYAYYRVAEDSSRWDSMNGAELKRRIKVLQADQESFEKMVDVVSCLRLAEIYYLRTKNKEEYSIPFVVTPQGEMLLVFTSKSQVKGEQYNEYTIESATYPSLISSITVDIKFFIINPDSQFLPLSVEVVNRLIKMMDEIEKDLDESMEQGLTKDALPPIMFERFLGRRIDCVTTTGTVIGDACQYDMEGGRAYLDVDKDDGSTVKVFYDEVVSIKDIANEARPE